MEKNQQLKPNCKQDASENIFSRDKSRINQTSEHKNHSIKIKDILPRIFFYLDTNYRGLNPQVGLNSKIGLYALISIVLVYIGYMVYLFNILYQSK